MSHGDVDSVTVIIVENEYRDWSSNSEFGLVWFGLISTSTIAGYLMPNPIHTYILNTGCLKIVKVKFATLIEGNPKDPFSIDTTPRCRGRRYSIPWVSPLYPWSLP